MPIDKFGRFASGSRRQESSNFPRTIGYSITPDGQIDLQGRQLKNIGEARESNDAVSRSILETVNESNHTFIETIFEKTIQYVDARHESTIQKVVNSQLEIKELIVMQEGKIRNLINTRCDAIEKTHQQIKTALQIQIDSIKQELVILDQHVQALHSGAPPDWQDPSPTHKVTRKQNVRVAGAESAETEEDGATELNAQPSHSHTERKIEDHWKSIVDNNDDTINN